MRNMVAEERMKAKYRVRMANLKTLILKSRRFTIGCLVLSCHQMNTAMVAMPAKAPEMMIGDPQSSANGLVMVRMTMAVATAERIAPSQS